MHRHTYIYAYIQANIIYIHSRSHFGSRLKTRMSSQSQSRDGTEINTEEDSSSVCSSASAERSNIDTAFDRAFIETPDVEKLFGFIEICTEAPTDSTEAAPLSIHKGSSDLNQMFGLSDDEDEDIDNNDNKGEPRHAEPCHAGEPCHTEPPRGTVVSGKRITELSDILGLSDSESDDSNKKARSATLTADVIITPCKKRRLENNSTSKVKAPHAPPLLPVRLPGIEHWQEPLLASMASRRSQLPEKPCRPMLYELYCTGMASEIPIFQAYSMLLLM